MTTKEYSDYVQLRSKPYTDENYCIIALNGEAGEVAEWYKKYLKGELGDVLYYLTRLASLNGWTLEDIMEGNKAKLDERVAKNMRMIS